MRLHRILQALGALAMLLLGMHLAWAGIDELTPHRLLRAAAFGVPALAMMLIGIALQRAEATLATPAA
jgi:hypothetical protein